MDIQNNNQNQDNERIFVIECCENCKEHQWNTRHDQAKYEDFFNRVASGIVDRIPGAVTMRNQIPKSYVDYDLYCNLIPTDEEKPYFQQVPRTGAFEVSYKGDLIFSKLQGCYWPNVELVANKCAKLIEAKEQGRNTQDFLAGMSPTKAGGSIVSSMKLRNGQTKPITARNFDMDSTGGVSLRAGGSKGASREKMMSSTFRSSQEGGFRTAQTPARKTRAEPIQQETPKQQVMHKEPSAKFLPAEASIHEEPSDPKGEPEEPKAEPEIEVTQQVAEKETKQEAKGIEIPEDTDPEVKKQLERAAKKFKQMDADGNGVLNGEELEKLAMWVFDSFHPGGEPIPEERRAKEAGKLLSRIDKNTDGVLEFDEFAGWFTKTCLGIQKFRQGRSAKDKEKAAKKVVMDSIKAKNKAKQAEKDKAAKAKVMEAYRAKKAAAKEGNEGVMPAQPDAVRDSQMSVKTVEFEAQLNPNASAPVMTCEWVARPDMSHEEFQNMVRQIFEASDANKNQVLTIDEFKQFTLYILEALQGVPFSNPQETLGAQFQRFDANKDGQLDWNEVWAMMQPVETAMRSKNFSWSWSNTITTEEFEFQVRQMFQAADANKNTTLSHDEFKQFTLFVLEATQGLNIAQSDETIDQMFVNFDKNRDGKLSWEEVWESMQELLTKIQSRTFSWNCTASMSKPDFKNMIKEIFDCADVNKDGVLILTEYKQFTLYVLEALEGLEIPDEEEEISSLFARFDTNQDGKLDWNEIWAACEPLQNHAK